MIPRGDNLWGPQDLINFIRLPFYLCLFLYGMIDLAVKCLAEEMKKL